LNKKTQHSKSIRQSFCKLWKLKRHKIDELVENKMKATMRNEKGVYGDIIDEVKDFSHKKSTTPNLPPNLSLLLPIKSKTRSSNNENSDSNKM